MAETGGALNLKATIPAGNSNANGITPNNPIEISVATEIIIKIIPTIFVLCFTAKAITSATTNNSIEIPIAPDKYWMSDCLFMDGALWLS